ncbi:hypothetical protein HX109_10915 [Galbibacter sp. BG1]|uniref:hypothetical protein n=1 Tax=Galbibacter sp. BG1 TaxID=1170699 RepID=UPI0015BB30EB|nr:hypothetical protein [Galbibacter sp. BG1]QLE02039.1 hypothetical protein HX109_10915 [Galbibacter sp. BG1]
MRKRIFIILSILFLYSCGTVSVNNHNQMVSDSQPQLGAIGTVHRNLLTRTFKTIATPVLDRKVRLDSYKEEFDKKKFKAYLSASPENEYKINYIDSIPEKPVYYSLQLADHIDYINSIKNDDMLVSYLENKPDAKAITSIAVALQSGVEPFFENAESIFLVYDKKLKKYYLELMENNGSTQKLHFNDLSIFAYDTSGFCWGANKKYEAELIMLSDGNKCASGLKTKASKVDIDKEYLSF